jgi:micrococcal nuclease
MRIAIPGAVLISIFAGYVIAASPTVAAEGTVIRVVDGDTVDVRVWGDKVRVRLLNIDTPETVDPRQPQECLGPESTEFAKSILPPGEAVQLEFDEQREDRYGRTLAHLVLPDGRYVSDEIARRGLGRPARVRRQSGAA